MKLIRRLQAAFLVLILLAGISQAIAQQGGQGSDTQRAPDPPSKDTPKQPAPTSQPSITQQQESRKLPQVPSPMIFITGRVILDNGEPAPLGTVVERECNGLIKKEAVVDPAGNFGFQVGGSQRANAFVPDASQGFIEDYYSLGQSESDYHYGFGPAAVFSRLFGCEVRAEYRGYRSSRIRLQEINITGPFDVGTIVLFPLGKVQGKLTSAANLMAPKEAKKSFEKAKKALEKQKLVEAEQLLMSSTEIYPKYLDAWFLLGRIYQQQSRLEDARNAFEKAIAIDGLYVESYVRLAQVAAQEQNWREAADLCEKALSLDPVNFPEAHFFNSLAHYNLNSLEIAEKSARQAGRLDRERRIPRVHLLIANILVRKNDHAGAIEEMRNYLKFAPNAPDADSVRMRLEKMLANSQR